MARLRGRILVLSLIALLFLVLAVQAEPSRVVPAEEILKKIELGQPVEYDSVTIVGDLKISKLELPRVFVARTQEEKEDSSLTENAKLVVSSIEITDCLILGSLDLNGAVLQENLNCENTEFKGSVYLIGTYFQQAANFRYAQFNQDAFFRYARFNHDADFEFAHFNQHAYFGSAQFDQDANFVYARFNHDANFQHARFNWDADFENARFNWEVDFGNAQFNQTDFWHAQFNQEAHFEDAKFHDLSFDNGQFSKEAFFDDARISGTLSLYRTKYDKLNIRWSSINDMAYDDTAYYLLIENFKKQGFTDDVNDCYFSYRCKHLWELWRRGEFAKWFFDFLAFATYGYGLRPVRPLGWSALFILLGGAFFFLTKSISRSKGPETAGKRLHAIRKNDSPQSVSDITFWEALLLSATYFTSGASAIISSVPQELRPMGKSRYVVVILRLLGWIFFVLFLTSLGKIA